MFIRKAFGSTLTSFHIKDVDRLAFSIKLDMLYTCSKHFFLGTHVQTEHEVRTFLRRVILDHCQSIVDRAFWLGRILKPWPMVHQARILFLLYGPEINGTMIV